MDEMQSWGENSAVIKKKKKYLCNLILTQPKMTKYKHVTQLAWTLFHPDASFQFEWFSDKLMPSLSLFTTLSYIFTCDTAL